MYFFIRDKIMKGNMFSTAQSLAKVRFCIDGSLVFVALVNCKTNFPFVFLGRVEPLHSASLPFRMAFCTIMYIRGRIEKRIDCYDFILRRSYLRCLVSIR